MRIRNIIILLAVVMSLILVVHAVDYMDSVKKMDIGGRLANVVCVFFCTLKQYFPLIIGMLSLFTVVRYATVHSADGWCRAFGGSMVLMVFFVYATPMIMDAFYGAGESSGFKCDCATVDVPVGPDINPFGNTESVGTGMEGLTCTVFCGFRSYFPVIMSLFFLLTVLRYVSVGFLDGWGKAFGGGLVAVFIFMWASPMVGGMVEDMMPGVQCSCIDSGFDTPIVENLFSGGGQADTADDVNDDVNEFVPGDGDISAGDRSDTPLPDLVVTDASVLIEEDSGDEVLVYFRTVIANVGKTSSCRPDVFLFLDNKKVTETAFSGCINPGNRRVLEVRKRMSGLEEGKTYSLGVLVDYKNTIPESNDGNNMLEKVVRL